MERLDLADLLLIAEAATDTPAEQLQHVVDVALAESALGALFAGFGDVEVHPETWEKIAALGY